MCAFVVFLWNRQSHIFWVCDIRINNCVGETNQKFFIQFLFYVGKWSCISVHLQITSGQKFDERPHSMGADLSRDNVMWHWPCREHCSRLQQTRCQAVITQLAHVTNTKRDHATCNICSNRLHLPLIIMANLCKAWHTDSFVAGHDAHCYLLHWLL